MWKEFAILKEFNILIRYFNIQAVLVILFFKTNTERNAIS